MELKDYMTIDEMRQLHLEWYPFLKINRSNVGRLATRLGYKSVHQTQNGKVVTIYVKKEFLKQI